jgi:hypothetical protein
MEVNATEFCGILQRLEGLNKRQNTSVKISRLWVEV